MGTAVVTNGQDSRPEDPAVLNEVKRILLVDDEDAVLIPMRRYFRNLGYAVDAAKEPEEAEALLDHGRYHLVILDLRLSPFGNEGLKVLRELRHHRNGTSVIVLSACVSPEAEEEAVRLGADAVLRKPQRLADLAQLAIALIGATSDLRPKRVHSKEGIMRAFLLAAFSLLLSGASGAPLLADALPASPSVEPIRVGGSVKPPAKLKEVVPVYPEKARRDRVQGLVILDCTVNAEGVVTDVKVLRPIPELNDAAIDAVKQWRYAPAKVDGVAVPIRMAVSVDFTIR
jgi:TonB family protein